ncbi:hypothetical protein NX059_002904 [Plenodomus lindquistii]|nr:hypothetical protein NX059_002904 [Plenodomus lindquistii]
MAQWADASSTNRIEHSSMDVNLADFDPNYDPSYDLEANCPMCRTCSAATPDKKLGKQLEKKYPDLYAKRRVEEEIERGSRIGSDGIQAVMILIGNKHRLVRGADDANQHDWTFFVRTFRPDLIQEVRIDLHPTFRPPSLTLRDPPFEVRRLGWGLFTIDAEIVLNEPYQWIVDNAGTSQASLELAWTLDFEGRGRQGRVRAKVKTVEVDAATRRSAQGRPLANAPELGDGDNAEDAEDGHEYTADDGDDTASSEQEADEELSEYLESPQE